MHKTKITYIAMSDERQNPFEQLSILPPHNLFIFRHYKTKERAALAFDLAHAARKQKKLFVVAKDRRLAVKLGALCSGVHLPEWQLKRFGLSAARRTGWIISAAVHHFSTLHLAARARLDLAILSPVFMTHTKHNPLGVCAFAALAESSPLPVYALGGMNPLGARRLSATKAAGWAGVSAFTQKRFTF